MSVIILLTQYKHIFLCVVGSSSHVYVQQ